MANIENWEQASVSTTGVFTGSGFVGPVTGAVTGNVTGDLTGNVVGNVAGYVIFPTSDPLVAGAWWDNAGTLTKSTGS